MAKGYNQTLLDSWSWAHLGTGIVLGLMGLPYRTFLVGHLIYDGAEQVVERTEWGQQIFDTKGPENLVNIAGDTTVASIGWWVGTKISKG